MTEFYVDIHCHSTMRAYHTTHPGGTKNCWDSTLNDQVDTASGRFAMRNSKRISKESQSNFYKCMQGNARVVFDSLYPLERGFINYRKGTKLLVGKKRIDALLIVASGVSPIQLHTYRNHTNYFEDLLNQYHFLVDNQGKSPCGNHSYKVVRNFDELQQSLHQDENCMQVIVTIEGCHALGLGTKETEQCGLDELKQKVSNHIRILKNWDYPPFFVTFAHHFWNQLCGHARTFPIETKLVLNQEKGINTGFTELGYHALGELLSNKNGPRILIDTRHMSGKARTEFARYIDTHNTQYPDDKIPFITSHSGMNGLQGFEHLQIEPYDKKGNPFYGHSINVSAEEARVINRSGGIMGVILDKGRLCSKKVLKAVEKEKDTEKQKGLYLKMIWDNLFFFVESVGHKSGWDNLTIGSDFDGVITHIDFYPDMSSLPELKRDMIAWLKTNNSYKKALWHGYKPEELAHKLFTENAMNFLRTHFNTKPHGKS